MQSFTMNYVQNFSGDYSRIQPLFVDGMTAVQLSHHRHHSPSQDDRYAASGNRGDLRNAACSQPLGVYVGVCKRCRECSGSSRG